MLASHDEEFLQMGRKRNAMPKQAMPPRQQAINPKNLAVRGSSNTNSPFPSLHRK